MKKTLYFDFVHRGSTLQLFNLMYFFFSDSFSIDFLRLLLLLFGLFIIGSVEVEEIIGGGSDKLLSLFSLII